MESKFIKASKAVTRMLCEGRIADLANYIKHDNSIENLFLMTDANELARNGVSINVLASKGSIINLEALLRKIENESLCKSLDRNLLKHYGFVIDRAMYLWKENQLESMCPALERDLDERAVTHLMKLWNDNACHNPFRTYMDNQIAQHVDTFINAIKNGTCNSVVSNDQLQYYTSHLENALIESWEKNHRNFKEIKAHLSDVLKDILLEDAKAGKLGEILQKCVMDKFREVLLNHITILDDLTRYPALNEKFGQIYLTLQAGKFTKNVSNETVEKIIQSYSQFDKKVIADINVLFRDEIIPAIIETQHIPIALKRATVNRVIRDQRNNAINLTVGSFVTSLLRGTITEKVREDICQNQGHFKGTIEKIIRQALFAFKHDDAEICAIIPDSRELFADIHAILLRLENCVDVHKSSDARVRQLERSLIELAQTINQLRAGMVGNPDDAVIPVVPTAPAAAVAPATNPATQNRRFFGFFDPTAAQNEPTNKPGASQSTKP